MDKKAVGLSVIIPVFNESANLPVLVDELAKVLPSLDLETEVIFVDDGSRDDSASQLDKSISTQASLKNKVRVIRFRKNFGQTAAFSAGIDASQGKLISFLDADLQNDPADLAHLIAAMNEDIDAVFGWRKKRQDNMIRVFPSRIANLMIKLLFKNSPRDMGCSQMLVRREFLTGLKLYGENHRLLPVLISLRGAKYKEIEVHHRPRTHEKSHYGFSRIFKVIIDLITTKFLDSYSTKPAYIFGSGGIVSWMIMAGILVIEAYKKIWLGVFIHNDPLFIIAIFFGLSGLLMVLMGLLAELLVRVYFESNKKAIYEVKQVREF